MSLFFEPKLTPSLLRLLSFPTDPSFELFWADIIFSWLNSVDLLASFSRRREILEGYSLLGFSLIIGWFRGGLLLWTDASALSEEGVLPCTEVLPLDL